MTRSLSGKVAVVTGAAQGIGAAYAARLSQLGATVVLADIDEEGASATAAGLRDAGGEAIAYRVDVSDAASAAALAAKVEAEHGRADVLVNNAAIFSGIRQ